MQSNRRMLFTALAGALAALALSLPAAAAADPNVAHVDGYVSINPSNGCVMLRQHDGSVYALGGRVVGMLDNDHVRLEGRFAANRCGNQGFAVTLVQTVWGDDRHKTTLYDHLHDGWFRKWAERNGRVHGEREWEGYPQR
jgi:hypothetical protein